MKKLFQCICLMLVVGYEIQFAHAQSTPEDPAHGELRVLRDGALAALNSGNIEELLKFVHPNIVFIGLDNRLSQGADQIKGYFVRMMTGPDRIVSSAHFDVKVDSLTVLYGTDKTTGISYGSSHDKYSLTSGLNFDINTRWTATLVKENGRWLIASFHSSADLFDNPLLNKSKSMLIWVGLGCLAGGLILSFLILWLLRRNKTLKSG